MVYVVKFHNFPVVVAKDWEVEIVILCKGLVCERIVDTYSCDLSVDLVQLLYVVTECAHFTGAHCGECSWEEGEYRCTIGFQKLLKGSRFSISVGECEVRSFFSLVNHLLVKLGACLIEVSKPYSS